MGPKNPNIETKPLTPVMEDYLETIFELGKEKKIVRVKDIAKRMNVKMPTVTSMLKSLTLRGMVDYEKYEYVELTSEGAGVGKEMQRRHRLLRAFLTDILKIDYDRADEEACLMEHILSPETIKSFTDFMDFVMKCPRAGESWLNHFTEFQQKGADTERCLSHQNQFKCEFDKHIESISSCSQCDKDL